MRPYGILGDIEDDLIAQFYVALHSDVKYKSRTIYSALDFLGDVGGFSDAIQYIGSILIWLLQGESLITYLVANLFKREDPEKRKPERQNIQEAKEVIAARKRLSISWCPSPFCCKIGKNAKMVR